MIINIFVSFKVCLSPIIFFFLLRNFIKYMRFFCSSSCVLCSRWKKQGRGRFLLSAFLSFFFILLSKLSEMLRMRLQYFLHAFSSHILVKMRQVWGFEITNNEYNITVVTMVKFKRMYDFIAHQKDSRWLFKISE